MLNYEVGEKLIRDAEIYRREALTYFKKGDWNKVIRRSQESFELYLKGIMKIIGIEVPKIHDIGKIFVESLKNRGLSVKDEIALKIMSYSSFLAERRAPAFYREEEYDEEEAKEAIEIMKFISKFVKKILKEIKR